MFFSLFPVSELPPVLFDEDFDDEMDLLVRLASPEDGRPPGLSLAEVPDGVGPMTPL